MNAITKPVHVQLFLETRHCSNQGALSGAVGAGEGHWEGAGSRSDIDDTPLTSLSHAWKHLVDTENSLHVLKWSVKRQSL